MDAPHTDTAVRESDLGDLDAGAHIESGRHRQHQTAVAPVRQIAEEVPPILDLVPQPAQRMALRPIGAVGLDHRAQRLSRPPVLIRRQAGAGHERVDRLRDRRIRRELFAQPAERLRERLELHGEARLDLAPRQAAALGQVEAGQSGQGVSAAAWDSDVVRKVPQWIADRVMDPGPAHIHRRTRQVHRVQPATDPLAGLQHHTLHPGVGQGIGHRQAGDPGTDDDHTFDRRGHAGEGL